LDDKALQKYRREHYPAFVVTAAEIMNVPPYFLMPMWSVADKQVSEQDKDNSLGNLLKYIKISKVFREVLEKKDLLSADKIKRYLDASVKTTEDN